MAFKDSKHTPRVFISSTAEDLEPYRQRAYDAANGAGFSTDRHENWPATGSLPLDESLKRVSGADVLVVIVAHRYGWVPPEQREGEYKSITWLECEEAISKGKEVLAFLLDQESDWPLEHKEENRIAVAAVKGYATNELLEEVILSVNGLKKFRAWLSTTAVHAKFTSPEDLRGRVAESLHHWRSRHAEFAFVEGPRRAQHVDEGSYRAWLQELTETIDIRGIAFRGQLEAYRFPLLRLYTELHVRSMRGEGARSVSAERRQRLTQIVGQIPRTVILGQPGSGKTTFLRRLAKKLVENNECLPLFLRLTDLYDHLTNAEQGQSPGWRLFISYWLQQSAINNWGFTESWLLAQMSERQVWVLMDSVDELPNQDARAQILKIIESAAEKWSRCRWVLTSRPGVLMGSATPDRFLHCEIDDLDDREIRDFVNAWVSCLFYNPRGGTGYKSGDEYAADLYSAIRDHADIRLLARNPLMLTSIAVIHWNQKILPEGRAELYEAVIEWLIRARRTLPNRKDVWTTEQCYQLLALEMFQHPEGRQTRVGYLWAAQKIKSYFEGDTTEKKVNSALRFLEQEEIDTGILVREGEGNIEFRHLSFQEYLAACKIASLTDDEEDGWWPLIKDKLYNSEWSNLLRFFPVRLLKLGDPRVKLFIKRVLKTGPSDSLAETARVVGFLARTLFDLRMYADSLMTVDEYMRAREKVMQIFNPESLSLSLRERFDAAVALGMGGDPRLFNPDENWVRIPGGVQVLGAQRDDPAQLNFDEFARDKEQPVHQVYTGSFEIGKYPVTVQEYAAFVSDGGYQNPSVWDAEGWSWRSNNDITSPDQWDMQQQYPNCPVVYICWYEAQAYCKWLTQVDEEMNYRLPSEAEWEYAARRGNEKYLRYCFGNISPDELRDEINWEHCGGPEEFESRIAPVGLFLADASRDGVMDVNGNVGEWMLDAGNSKYQSSPLQASLVNQEATTYLRVLRGGSYQNLSHNCRTSFRTSVLAENRYPNVGFRVMRTRRPIALKGQRPRRHYRTTLADVFAKHGSAVYSHEEASQLLSSYAERCAGLNADIIAKLFPAGAVRDNRSFDRLPCVLADAPPTKLDFNLLYQDSRIKLAVEEKLSHETSPEEFERDAAELMEVVSILLRAKGIHNSVLWQDLTDNDLDAITYMALERYDSDRAERLLADGHRVNQIALATLPISLNLSLEELIEHQIFAGTIWWSEGTASLQEQFGTISSLEISDTDLLKKEALTEGRHLIFFFDDNGELVWDLAFIMRMLEENPALSVTGVVSTQPVANNSNVETLSACLKHPFLAGLKESKRFKIFAEYNTRSAIDPKFCSSELIEVMQSTDVAFVKGVAMFETMQKLPVPTYYGFVVHSRDSQICTGMRKGSGVFVRIPPGGFGYVYHQQTLRELYPKLRGQS